VAAVEPGRPVRASVYERQPGESRQALAAFIAYRDLGPARSLAKVGQKLGKSTTLMERWSARWRWTARAAAWDEELDRQARAAQVAAVKEMAERHVKLAKSLQFRAIERLNTLDPNELSPSEVLRYIVEAVKLERLAMGEPETVQEDRHQGGDGDEALDRML